MAARSTGRTIADIASLIMGTLLVAALVLLIAGPAAASASPTIEAPPNGSVSNNPTPTVSGSTEDLLDDVSVTIYSGAGVGGSAVQTLTTLVPPATGSWSLGPFESLPDGTYTAQATQAESSSAPVTFHVLTAPPTVTLNSIKSVSNETTPSFSGKASDTTTVVVHIFNSSNEEVASASASGTGGGWSSGSASPALADGHYTAQATQESSLGNGTGHSNTIGFTISTASPTVKLNPIETPSNDTTPSFSGTASDTEPVTVYIFSGSKAGGSAVSSASASGTGGGWTSGSASPALSSGSYTAVAVQESSLGNERGVSNEVHFVVSTAPPSVKLNSIKALSNDTTPSFSGEASDTTTVVVHIFNSSNSEVATASASGTGGGWSSGAASPALADGHYTAVATQESSLGNGTGHSNTIGFSVSTAPPSVSLTSPGSPTNNARPSFSGNASDTTEVVVHIYNSLRMQVATATASGTGGGFTTGQASTSLASGEYFAVATQASSLGNEEGRSNEVSFIVDTNPPTVKLFQPKTPSNNTKPSFSGEASDTKTVVVHILNTSHSQVAEAFATGTGGGFTTGQASPALSPGEYTAVATQESSLGNAQGESNAVSFVVNTSSPTVTLNPVKSLSNNTTPSFGGFASDTEPVTVYVHRGTSTAGSVAAEAHAAGNGGNWSSGSAAPGLADGTYTAQAVQNSSLGNSAGFSNTVTFTVSTAPPSISLNQPQTPSNHSTPSFSGSSNDTEPIVIRIYAGSTVSGSPVAAAGASGNGGSWTSGQASPALGTGQYTAQAEQKSSLGNSSGFSNAVTFFVDLRSPTVTLNGVAPLSNNTTPTFSGAASDSTQVVVHILNAANQPVETATAGPSGGGYSTHNESSLPSGSYSAYATQSSSLGNPEGVSSTISFAVETASPKVTLQAPGRTNNPQPSFSGTASDSTPVTVNIYKGSGTGGQLVATASATGPGAWTSSAASPALANGLYTAQAVQPSSLGNPEGKSAPEVFEVNTNSPTVTLEPIQTPWHNTTPAFTGTASEPEPVTVKIYKGPKPEGSVVATATAPGTGGAWTSAAASPALASGTYTATATQPSRFSNPPGISAAITFVVETASPKVTLNAIAKLSNNATPTFTGTGSDTTPVTVSIYAGAKAEGVAAATATATGTGTTWTSTAAAPALLSGEYTATASQPSSAGNEPGVSAPINFTVNTLPPTVSLTQPKSPANVTKPTFTGKASDTTAVTVHIFNAEQLEVGKATATPSGGAFSAGNEPLLSDGTYTAKATQESSLKNPEGVSNIVTFVVDTKPPAVTLTAPPTPSNNRTPVFSGTASDTTPVTVKIYKGTRAEGSPVATATGTPATGKWTSLAAAPALADAKGTYTAIASEESSIGNPTGVSNQVFFVVDPAAPTVTLNPPPARTNSNAPAFSGTASDVSPVSIEVFAGASVSGTKVASATAAGTGGGWGSGPVSPALPDGTYTVQATQANRFTTQDVGTSNSFSFVIDTVAPRVTLTSPGNGSTASGGSQLVQGTAGSEAGDLPGVTVQLFAGGSAEGALLQSNVVNAVAGSWSTIFAGLAPGSYTVRALQSDEAGNIGVSSISTFVVPAPAGGIAAFHSSGPAAAFVWFPAHPRVGERVTLVSTSTDTAHPISAYAWDVSGKGTYAAGGQQMSTSFATVGNHTVHLRVVDSGGTASVATETIAVAARRATLMRPFPSVKILTTKGSGGAYVQVLIVQAPVGARITVTCSGRGCPLAAQSRVAKASRHSRGPVWVNFKAFQRFLPGGVKLEIRVSKAGQIGAYTLLSIRKGGGTERLDRCLSPTNPRPMRCPGR